MNTRHFNVWEILVCVAIGVVISTSVNLWLGHPVDRIQYLDLGARTITCYQAVKEQCDSEPDIGAGGRVAVNGKPTGHWFACNWLPFGTKIVIPSISGDTVWTCRDRMHRRFSHRVDLLVGKDAVIVGGKRIAKVYLVKREN